MDYTHMSSQELIDLHRRERLGDESIWDAMCELHRRGSQTELQLALQLAAANEAVDREMAANLLAQLGGNQPTFVDESVDALIALLSDSDPDVVAAAAAGLGHRPPTPRALAFLLALARSSYNQVRYGVVIGLLAYTEQADLTTIEMLIELSRDEDIDVRNWATFGLAR